MERSKADTKKNKTAYHILIKIQNIVIFNTIWKKYNEIKLTKNKMDFK